MTKRSLGARGKKKAAQRVKKIHVQRGDKVYILSGNDKGKEGKVLQVLTATYRAVVEGCNQKTKHIKPTGQAQGKIEKREAPIHISNLKVIDPNTGKPTKIGRKFSEEKKRLQRYSKTTGNFIPDVYAKA